MEITANGKQVRIEYDIEQYCIVIHDMNGGIGQMAYCRTFEELDKIINHVKQFDEITKEGFYSDEEAPLIQAAYENIRKIKKWKITKDANPYKKMDKEELKKIYFETANNELPKILANGFLQALQKYKKDNSGENEFCCILDIGKRSKMVFVYGDGSDCENANDEMVFYKFPCDEILYKCKLMVEAIDTLNLGQESSHWLTDAVALAENENVFNKLSVTIYGNVQYGKIELDVIYENIK
jgi:hypothetical protein